MFYTKSLALVTLTKASICVLLNIRFEVNVQPAPWSQMLQSITRHEAKCSGMFGLQFGSLYFSYLPHMVLYLIEIANVTITNSIISIAPICATNARFYRRDRGASIVIDSIS